MNMLERMAIASLKAREMHPLTDEFKVWKLYKKEEALAEMKAILEAMKEPTEKMITNGAIFIPGENDFAGFVKAKENAKLSWQSMIETALKD